MMKQREHPSILVRFLSRVTLVALFVAASTSFAVAAIAASDDDLDDKLYRVLRNAGFTGTVERTLETRLGRKLQPELADLGRLLFFDTSGGLHNDNTCAGCHAPGFG